MSRGGQLNSKGTSRLRLLGRALRSRNYRLFFAGNGISLTGTWMQRVATGWLVYRLTGSALALGVVGFAGQIPAFLIGPFAGVLADRWDRRRMILVTQSLAMVQAFILAGLTLAGWITLWQVVLLAACLGLVNALDIPTRQAFVIQTLDREEDLTNAIALHSTLVNATRIIGPAVAGVLIHYANEGVCFLINGITYSAVVVALLAMRVRRRREVQADGHILHRLHEGLRYAFGFPPIRSILLLLALVSLVGVPYRILMPVFVKEVLHGGPNAFGLLMAATGVGAIAAAVFLALRHSVRGLGRVIALAPSIFGVGLIALGLSRSLWLSMLVMPVVGFGLLVLMAASNTVLQTIADDDKRGRVMSFYAMSFMCVVPLGSLLAGGLASRMGAPATTVIGGVGCIVGSAYFVTRLPALRRLVHPIYVRKGIIPEVASGIQAASEMPAPPKN